MKSLSEHIDWQKAPEHRAWKRRLQFAESIILSTAVLSSSVAVLMQEGRQNLEPVFLLFSSALFVSLLVSAPFFLSSDVSVSRYLRSFILLGFLAGAGSLAGFGLLILMVSQHAG